MVLRLSVPAFTLLHVLISLVAIGPGLTVLIAMANGNRLSTALFLFTTFLTSVTGFLFPPKPFGPPHLFGVLTLAALIPLLLARYVFDLRGWWRLVYFFGATFVLYLNCVVAVVQSFQKLSILRPLAPTQTEPPFLIAQGLVLLLCGALALTAALRFRPAPGQEARAPLGSTPPRMA